LGESNVEEITGKMSTIFLHASNDVESEDAKWMMMIMYDDAETMMASRTPSSALHWSGKDSRNSTVKWMYNLPLINSLWVLLLLQDKYNISSNCVPSSASPGNVNFCSFCMSLDMDLENLLLLHHYLMLALCAPILIIDGFFGTLALPTHFIEAPDFDPLLMIRSYPLTLGAEYAMCKRKLLGCHIIKMLERHLEWMNNNFSPTLSSSPAATTTERTTATAKEGS
nr:hypothetical protein [Tanacetum cinerariifolium]